MPRMPETGLWRFKPCLSMDRGEIVSESRIGRGLFALMMPSVNAEHPISDSEDDVMKVKGLIEKLSLIDPNREVIMQRDPDACCCSPLVDLWEGAYRLANEWFGEAGFEILTERDREKGFTEEDLILDGQRAVFLQLAV